mmetsp:Transcript_56872/g.147831  ORF Transcript_56872/g.147831 Transcript_56872/m.147831 type:complete len:229 (-) Transcript_56872:1158-1844(-)
MEDQGPERRHPAVVLPEGRGPEEGAWSSQCAFPVQARPRHVRERARGFPAARGANPRHDVGELRGDHARGPRAGEEPHLRAAAALPGAAPGGRAPRLRGQGDVHGRRRRRPCQEPVLVGGLSAAGLWRPVLSPVRAHLAALRARPAARHLLHHRHAEGAGDGGAAEHCPVPRQRRDGLCAGPGAEGGAPAEAQLPGGPAGEPPCHHRGPRVLRADPHHRHLRRRAYSR